MRSPSLVAALAAVVCVGGAAYAWRARTLTEYQKVRIVATLEAESFDGAAAVTIEDKYASGGKAVRLAEGGPAVSFSRRLPPGVYAVWLYARVPGSSLGWPSPPLYVEATIAFPDGRSERSRQRVSFLPIYQDVTRLFFIAREEGDYRVSLSVGKRSTAALWLDFVEIRDELAGLPLKPLKAGRYATGEGASAGAPARRPPARARAAGSVPLVLSEKASVDDMARLARNVRDSMPPVNAMLGGCDGPTKELAELAKAQAKGDFKPTGLLEPWALVDEKTGARYDASSYAAGEFFMGGLPDDGGGYFAPDGAHGVKGRPLTVATLGAFFGGRLGSLCALAQQRALDYEQNGDLASAREAAILLALLADRYPTFCERVQSLANNFGIASYERFSQSAGAWLPVDDLALAYDRIFEAIRNDAHLAQAVGAVIPSVKSPDDLRAFLDRNLLQYGLERCFRFSYRTMQMGWERRVSDLLLVLGPNEAGQAWMDRFLQRQCYADLTGDGGYLDYLINGVNRDGCNYIGATTYTSAVPALMVRNAMALERFARLGGRVSPFAYDPAVNRRLLEAGRFYLAFRTGGGFSTIFGDGGGAIDQRFDAGNYAPADVLLWLFGHTADPRYAWLLRSAARPADADDETWARIEAAAEGQKNPVLHAQSTVMTGFGCTLLELGSESPDPKQKGSACVRFGTGFGHQHGDLLDLTLYAYNQRIVSDGGRSGWPWMRFTAQHNTVEVDRRAFQSTNVYSGAYGFPLLLREVDGARFASAGGWCSIHPDLDDYRRDVAMIDLGEHEVDGASLRHYYVFDVIRVGGGRVHTYSTHGVPTADVTFNVKDEPAPDGPPGLLYGAADPKSGVTADPMVTTWRADGPRAKSAPVGLRHHLFGWGGLRFYCARGAHRTYNFNIPFLWIERESPQPLRGAYAAVFEPFYAQPNLASVKELKVEGGDSGSRAARAVQVVSRWGRTDTVVTNDPGRPVRVEGGLETDGHFAFLAEDAQGVVQATLVGGTFLRRGGVQLTSPSAAYEGRVVSFDARTLELKTDPPLPPDRAAGALVSFGRLPHKVGEYVLADGGRLRLRESPVVFRSPVARVDPAASAVHPAIALPLTVAEPRFYDGCAATNEKHDRFWRVERAEIAEMWMPLFSPIRDSDITDADGDGRRTVRLTNFAPPENTRDPDILYYGPFHKPVRMRQYNREPFPEPVVLEVTRVDEAARILHFKPPLHDYDLCWNHWVYEGVVITNERGDRQWRGNVPAREFRLVLAGDRPADGSFIDAETPWREPQDGQGRIFLYDFGPGDPYRLETHVSARRGDDGAFRVEQNTDGRAVVPVPAR